MLEPPAAFWCRIPSRPNFGDALTPWLINRLTGSHPVFRRPEDPRHKYLVSGSIIAMASPKCTVWGAGIMCADDSVAAGVELRAVRGPLTRARALASGVACPEIYGDPALLLPRLYKPAVAGQVGIGLAPHFSDYPRLSGAGDRPSWVHLIDMQGPIEFVIDRISRCELVAASSLHGLIVSHAYGVPATWVEFRPLPSGDRSKFRDYLLSIGCDREQPLSLAPDRLTPALLRAHAIDPPRESKIDYDRLWQACPFRRTL